MTKDDKWGYAYWIGSAFAGMVLSCTIVYLLAARIITTGSKDFDFFLFCILLVPIMASPGFLIGIVKCMFDQIRMEKAIKKLEEGAEERERAYWEWRMTQTYPENDSRK